MPHKLLTAWRHVRTKPPYVLPEDEVILRKPEYQRYWCQLGLKDFLASSEFGARDSKLHLGLMPIPFLGRITSAPIVLLALNPGLNPVDYFGEYRYDLRAVRRRNLTRPPAMPWLDPAFSWHSGFMYWHRKLRGVIDEVARARGLNHLAALEFVGHRIALLELVPYHSSSFGLPKSLVNELPSVGLVRSFVRQELVPRAKAGHVLLICTRAAKRWELPRGSGAVLYNRPGEARGASMSLRSRGGKAILKRLLP